MDVSISSRQTPVTPRLEEVVNEKIGNLDRFLDGLDTAEVHFEEARNPRIADKETCEVTVVGNGHQLRTKVSAPDPFTAVDLATAKLERQIRKLRTKLDLRSRGRGRASRDGRSGSLGAVITDEMALDDGEVDDDEEYQPRIVKTKRFHLGPLDPDEAALKMDLLGHGFFFFINRETGRSAVVYQREDGDVGLIDEAD
jgi:putative sigma-54 modulation protein